MGWVGVWVRVRVRVRVGVRGKVRPHHLLRMRSPARLRRGKG